MGWLKRNIFFAVGGILSLGLLAAAGYYDYASWDHNQVALTSLQDTYNKLSDLAKKKPSPGNESVTNIATAKAQENQLNQWKDQAKKRFQPIPRIPATGPLNSQTFGHALTATIKQLQDEATAANVQLPPQFPFSFTAHMGRLSFTGGSLGPLSEQLGEVKAISEILYSARVNELDGIQRVRVSDDDSSGPQADYLNEMAVTNDLGVLTPYQVTFSGFSPEVAQVLVAFATSPNGFIVKTMSVQPVGAAAITGNPNAVASATSALAPMPAPVMGRGGLQTILNEQLLRVTIEVVAVKMR